MAKHIHADVIKAWADGAEIQARCRTSLSLDTWGGWCTVENPEWLPHQEYRIKLPPKPDMVFYGALDEPVRGAFSLGSCFTRHQDSRDKLKITFNGETGKLKSVEIL
jgi:hypothetical protein